MSQLTSHFHRSTTRNLVSRNFWWLGVHLYVMKYISFSDLCFLVKNLCWKSLSLLKLLPIASQHWFTMALDFTVDLHCSHSCTVLFVTIDLFTVVAHLCPFSHSPYHSRNCSPLSTAHLLAPWTTDCHCVSSRPTICRLLLAQG